MKVLPESKVTVPLAVNVAVGLVLQLLQTYVHGFHAPPAATVAGIVTVVTFVAGWLAPHTSRPNNPTIDAIAKAAATLGLEIHPVAVPVDPAPIGRGGYTGGKPASEMPPPPADVPSVSKLPDGGGGGAP